MKRNWIPVYTATILLLASLGSAHAARNENPAALITSQSGELRQQVEQWADELARQPSFDRWNNADIDISALGPGTHSWYVSISREGQAVGYMIVHARPEGGFKLGEYGHGSVPMYEPKTLHRSLVQLELIPSSYFTLSQAEQEKDPMFTAERLYLNPLQSVWKVTLHKRNNAIQYFDAKTGEYMPITEQQWLSAESEHEPLWIGEKALPALTSITSQRMNRSFDPYIRFPWLTQPPLQGDLQSVLTDQLDQQRKIWFSSEPFGTSQRYVWPVIGYQQWDNGQRFIAVDQEGARFIPIESLQLTGHFYN